ncbi:type I pullulanase [Carnobacterium sp. PL24RED07]|uniref:type I pullulanase n=1 Tax=unclassified Carnobacterium TaxID=257487 RepID=UPI0011EC3622|nr:MULTISPECIES: type I pullulanase [unclassified Carnobacterium]KAF3298829.1 type I pullulanase [Carnobacterium sp. PL26RED25]KAF3303962.1 type I pullulanase [Carnobacterium sp. PL24RED07]
MAKDIATIQEIFDLIETADPELISLRMRETMESDAFDKAYYYDGFLGYSYSKTSTLLRIWTPTAIDVELLLYKSDTSDEYEAIQMEEELETGTYAVRLEGDYKNVPYMYRIFFPNSTVEITQDPYSQAVTVNGARSVIVDLDEGYPDDWENDKRPSFANARDAIIYEASVRDLTSNINSGVPKEKRGEFAGLALSGTKTANEFATGLDYIADLGITHLQLMPMADFVTVDELSDRPDNYNWGYDPMHYNVPEGSYSMSPRDPVARLKEMREMVQALHAKGLRVVMDVVYNHVYEHERHPLGLTVPYYYFRYNKNGDLSNGSGVGNETDSTRLMFRRYMIESITYWAEEFHIDGFRFDLMGLHDIETLNLIREALDKIDPSILMYGEGWDLETLLSSDKKAILRNAYKTPHISYFNDQLRDQVRGSDYGDATDPGFITGKFMTEQAVLASFLGGGNLSKRDANVTQAQQLIQYIEVHDNYTLRDKIALSHGEEPVRLRKRRQLLGNSIIALSAGIPFFHSGQEFFRTKHGVRDSYNSGDEINCMDWDLMASNYDAVNYFKGLLALRKKYPFFTEKNQQTFFENVTVIKSDYQIIGVHYHGLGHELVVIFNGQLNDVKVWIPEGGWRPIARDNKMVGDDFSDLIKGNADVKVSVLSTLILERVE